MCVEARFFQIQSHIMITNSDELKVELRADKVRAISSETECLLVNEDWKQRLTYPSELVSLYY